MKKVKCTECKGKYFTATLDLEKKVIRLTCYDCSSLFRFRLGV